MVSVEADDTDSEYWSMLKRVWPVRLLRVHRRCRTEGEVTAEEEGEDEAEEEADD